MLIETINIVVLDTTDATARRTQKSISFSEVLNVIWSNPHIYLIKY